MRQSNGLLTILCAALVACGSRDAARGERAAKAGGPPLGAPAAAPSSPPPPAPRPLHLPKVAPSDRTLPEPASPLFAGCADGFEPDDDPRVTALRLGMICGPVNGMLRFGRTRGALEEGKAAAAYEWDAEKSDCFRVFVAGAPSLEDVAVEVVGPVKDAQPVSAEGTRWAMLAEDRAFCAPLAGTYRARFRTHGGKGAFAAEVWRGKSMLAAVGRAAKEPAGVTGAKPEPSSGVRAATPD